MSPSARRHGRRLPPGVRYEAPKPRRSYQQRHHRPTVWSRTWRATAAIAGLLAIAVLVGIAVWANSQPPKLDQGALHSDIAAGRSGAEVTFVGTVVVPPVSVGDHERIEVKDRLGDQLELDYNTQLGQWISLGVGDQLTVHGQLYIDPGRVGVHCLHAQTSSGCPVPGWIEFAGRTYS